VATKSFPIATSDLTSLRETAKAAGLRYVSDSKPGIVRVRARAGFGYRHPDSSKVSDEETLTRIRKLAIPPAYENVWICTDPNGHLQAVGRDARGRKRYRYHLRWREAPSLRPSASRLAIRRPMRRLDQDSDIGFRHFQIGRRVNAAAEKKCRISTGW
jgi:DNA topoisomerase IB